MARVTIKKWTGLEDQIVLLYATGHFSYGDLAERFNLSADKIKKTVQDPRAEAVLEEARRKIREGLVAGVEDDLPAVAKLAVLRIKETLEAQISPIHPAKANQDRVALSVLKGLGYLREEGQPTQPGLTLSPEQHSALISAIERANRVKEIEVLPEAPATVVE